MGVRLGSQAGQVGNTRKALYSARYDVVAGANNLTRPTTYNGKQRHARDRDLMERAINEVAQS